MKDFIQPYRKANISTIVQLGAAIHEASSQFSDVRNLESLGLLYLEKYIAVHMPQFAGKYHILIIMARKLLCLVKGACSEDNADSFGHQELLLPGSILSALLQEQVAHVASQISSQINHDCVEKVKHSIVTLPSDSEAETYFIKLIRRYAASIGKSIETFLATGNLVSPSGLDLQQNAGFVVAADRLNAWRFCSHFRAVHRGHFFTTMKTTSVRKLLPEAWGFLCPIHTPDGAPCGLLSHLASSVRHSLLNTIDGPAARPHPLNVRGILLSLGMSPCLQCATWNNLFPSFLRLPENRDFPILLDGVVMGFGCRAQCRHIVLVLRNVKCRFRGQSLSTIEIAHFVCDNRLRSPFEGVYLFSAGRRMSRPVARLSPQRCVELLGPLEQLTLQISWMNPHMRELQGGSQPEYSHAEIDPSHMLSVLASLTPFSDYNQSPRNMYQCQMGKQTMGIPAYGLQHRGDNKLYQMLTPQAPLVATSDYWRYEMDRFAQGINSVVAVISYSGYDMEDAMVVKRSSFERGFGRGVMFKTHVVNLKLHSMKRRTSSLTSRLRLRMKFGRSQKPSQYSRCSLDLSGLPEIGRILRPGDVMWCAVDDSHGEVVGLYHDAETAYVDAVRYFGCAHCVLCRD